MANNLKLSNAAVNAEADALSVLLDNGYIRIYDGTQPTNADTAIGAQVLLAELRFNADAAPVAVNGVLTFNAITQDSSANASGTPAWARAYKSDGTTVMFDCTVGLSGCDLQITASPIAFGASVGANSFVYTVAKE
ncbi:MAG: hypothetical protein Q7S87_04675 [Agitococcus sp.]|nr:hypothetical protein [Agitococcus sp.]